MYGTGILFLINRPDTHLTATWRGRNRSAMQQTRPNKPLQPTAYSVPLLVAPARFGGGWSIR